MRLFDQMILIMKVVIQVQILQYLPVT